MQLISLLQKITLYIFFFSVNFEVLAVMSDFSVAKLSGMLYLIMILPNLRQFFCIENLTPVLLPILLFFSLLTINNALNINEQYNEVFNVPFILNLLFFLFMINHIRTDYLILEKAMLCFVFGTIVLTMLFTLGIGITYVDGRVTMFGDNQNNLGLKVATALIITMVVIVQDRLGWGWYRFLLLIPVPFMLRFTADTGSRVAVITLALAFGVGVVLMKTDSFRNKILVLVGGVIVFAVIGMQLMQSEMLMKRLSDSSKSGDLSGRDKIWAIIIPLIEENPIFGVGNTGYDYYAMLHLPKSRSPHNVILEVLCYTGIVGLAFYLVFVYQLFIRGFKSYLKNGWLLPLLLLTPVMGMILSAQVLHDKLGWIIFAYLVGSSAIPYNKNRLIK